MDKETKKKLFIEVLSNNKPPFVRLNIDKIADELVAIDSLGDKAINSLIAEQKAKEIAELEAEKAKALETIQEAEAKLSILKVEAIEITK